MEAARAVAARAIKKASETEVVLPTRLLFEAVSKGELERVRELAIKNVNANHQERHRGSHRTPIHQAAELGYLDICKVLCEEAQASIATVDKDGNTPFHLACARGHYEIVKYFQQRYDPDPTLRNARSYTAFHLAAFGGHLDVIKFLDEEAGVDPHCEDQFWNTAAHHAASRGHLSVLVYLCGTAKLNPASVNRWKRTPLHLACAHGHTEVARYLVKQCHVDPNAASLDGCTPLHLAVTNGHLETTQYLIDGAQVDPNPKNVSGDTPVHCAAFSGQAEICKFLFEKGRCDVNVRNANGDTPVIVAAIWNQQAVLRYLIEAAKADPCLKNEMGFTAMHMAAREWNQEVCEYICKVAPECARIRDNKGLTPLMVVLNKWGQTKVNRMFLHKEGYSPFHVACEKGFEDMVRYLLICAKDYGELIHTPGANGDTPLIAVIERDHTRLIELLLQKGADVNFRSKNGNTPLLTAIREQNMKLVKMLLANSAKINYPTDGDHTPLTLACSIGNMDFINLLLKEGAELELPNRNGETPLVMACKMRNMDLILALLEYGSQINYPTTTKFTPLIAACMFGEVDMVSLLLARGAVIDMPNVKRGTPLAAASKRGHADIVRLLLNRIMSSNLPVDVSGVSGHTPVMKASMHGHADVVRMLVDSGASICLPDTNGNTPAIAAARKHHAQVLRFLVEQGADVDAVGEQGHSARAFAERDAELNGAIREGLKVFQRRVRGPIEKLQALGYLNGDESVVDGFYFASDVVPVSAVPSSFAWGKVVDPRDFPIGTIQGALVALDARRDPRLRRAIARAQALTSSSFPNVKARVAALAMFVASELGGTALADKAALSRGQQERVRNQLGSDVLALGALLPGYGIGRTRSVVFKYLLAKVGGSDTALSCRIVSRPSSGSGWDRVDDPWPCDFCWTEIAFDDDGPYFVVDMMKVPGMLLFENSSEAAAYRSGAVYDDDGDVPGERQPGAFQEISARDEIVRFDAAAPGAKRRRKKGRRKKKRTATLTKALSSPRKASVASPTLDNIDEGTSEADDDDGAASRTSSAKKKKGKAPPDDSESDGEAETTQGSDATSPTTKADSDGSDNEVDVATGPALTEQAQLEKEEEENSLAIGGRVDWPGVWLEAPVQVTRYPVPSFFNDAQKEQSAAWFKDDMQYYASLRHRCIERPLGVDPVTRSVIHRRQPNHARLDDYIRERHADLDDDVRLSIVLQIAETMEYLHTRTPSVIHGRLRVKDVFVAVRERPMVRLFDVGLPRRVEPLIKQYPFVGAAAYYPPERLLLEAPEGDQGADTMAADVYAFGVVAVFVASAQVPWNDFQVRNIREFFADGKRPGLPDDCTRCSSWKPVIERCFEPDPAERPSFTQVIRLFQQYANKINDEAYVTTTPTAAAAASRSSP